MTNLIERFLARFTRRTPAERLIMHVRNLEPGVVARRVSGEHTCSRCQGFGHQCEESLHQPQRQVFTGADGWPREPDGSLRRTLQPGETFIATVFNALPEDPDVQQQKLDMDPRWRPSR